MKKDKPEVSFKINGKKVDIEQEKPKQSNPSESPGQDIEKVRVADWKEKRAAEEEQAAAFWEEEYQLKRPSVPYKKIRKKPNIHRKVRKPRNPRKSYPIYFISLTVGAVSLGLLFGIVMLQLFPQNNSPTNAAIDSNEQDPPIEASFSDTTTIYVIQVGAFTEKEKGIEMQEQFHANGYPAVLTHDGDYYYLFSGVSFDEKGAQRLKEYYESEGVEMYEKTRTIPEPQDHDEGSVEEKEKLLTTKELLINLTDEALQDESGQGELQTQLDDHLEDTIAWQDDEAFQDLRHSLQEISEEWSEETKSSSTIQELLIEALLYYEESVYTYNGEGEENIDGQQEPQ